MSHLTAVTMETLFVLMVLFSVDAARSHRGVHGLVCTNDFVNNVSCTWNSSSVGPGVDCWISGVKKIWTSRKNGRQQELMIRGCKLKQHGHSAPGCSFVFERRGFSGSEVMPNISMRCNGSLVESIMNYKPQSHIKMHPPGVPNVSTTVNDTWISWSLGSPISEYLTSFDFHVEVKQKNRTWREARPLSTQEQELRIPAWQLTGLREVRVRVKPTNRPNSRWSDWSPTASWVGATDRVDTSSNQDWRLDPMSLITTGVMLILCLIVVVTLGLYRSCKTSGILKTKPVPNPSKYFSTFHSVHGGNLKEWLNPLSVSQSFFTAQPCDHISRVEVCEDWDVVPSTSPSSSFTSALLHFQCYPSPGSDTSGIVDNSSSSSCFSNMGYFMSSSSSGSARTDPSPAYFTYQDDFHNHHNLHLSLCPSFSTCPAYESLKREPQSPDSGFGIREEDEKDDEMVMDAEEEQGLDVQGPPLLILPLHLPPQICPPPSPPASPHPLGVSQTSSDSQQVDVPAAGGSGSSAAWISAGAMCRSSSMPVESCKTGYMTLKELQATFSNKSI